MNPIIEKQLRKCKVASIPEVDSQATRILIPKVQQLTAQSMFSGHLYLIKIRPSVRQDVVLAANWNGGRQPQYTYYKVEKLNTVGTMVKLNGIAYDAEQHIDLVSESFYGFLPADGFEIIQEI